MYHGLVKSLGDSTNAYVFSNRFGPQAHIHGAETVKKRNHRIGSLGRTQTIEPSEAIALMGTHLANLRDEGQSNELEKVLTDLVKILKLPENVLPLILQDVEAQAKLGSRYFGEQLKQIADEARCEFDYRPPFSRFGVVTIKEKQGGKGFELSVLDGVPLETLQTSSAHRVAQAALHWI